MHRYLLIIVSLLFSLIYGSSRNKYRVTPYENLKIEKFDSKLFDSRPKSIIYRNGESRCCLFSYFMDRVILYDLYRMVENGKIIEEMNFESHYIEIFELNDYFIYTPAEWAVYNGKVLVLKAFIERSQIISQDQRTVSSIFLNLAALAIQRNNLEALKCVLERTTLQVENQGFLSIAAQHHSSEQIIDFLLNECELKSELDQTNSLKSYLSPLNASIKFNNFDATIAFLKHGASLIFDYAKHYSPLASIFRLNKYRILGSVLKNFPEYCNIIDIDGDSLYHYAIIYSNNPDMISMVYESCPNLLVNTINFKGLTPLDRYINYFPKQEMVLKLISIGADIFHVPEEIGKSPLQIIIQKFQDYFSSILEIYQDKPGQMTKLVDFICESREWKLLDRILEFCPAVSVSKHYFTDVSLDELLLSKAWRTFRLCLRMSNSPISTNSLLKIAESGSKDFFRVAIENGADIEEISDFDKQRILEIGNEEMFNFIEDLVNQQKINSIKQFNFE